MALIPPSYLDAVAALGSPTSVDDEGNVEYKAIATGTIVGFKAEETDEDETPYWALFLVTNKHVIRGEDVLFARVNQGDRSVWFRIDMEDDDGEPAFVEHERFDIAITALNPTVLDAAEADYGWLQDEHFLDLSGLEAEGITGGDGVFVLGFPMGLAGKERMYVVVRGGVIARLDQDIVDETDGYLVDGAVFPGNSGGPVVLRPEMTAISGTESHDRARVIGIVSSYLPYKDFAVSSQTGNVRVVFEENSGLASVVPMDPVVELARKVMHEKPFRKPANAKLESGESESDSDGEKSDK